VVVAVGLTVVEPVADVEVNVPGVMVMLVALVADQLSSVLVPELIVVGLAVKDVITGAGPFPEPGSEETAPTQLVRAMQAKRIRARAQRFRADEPRCREWGLLLQRELRESMRVPSLPTSLGV
jgi:hypothetical protein